MEEMIVIIIIIIIIIIKTEIQRQKLTLWKH